MQIVSRWFINTFIEKRYKKEIERLSQNIEKRILKTLAPIEENTSAKEIRPLVNAINRLISYFENRSIDEQDFSANASHELRTPLAGIRIQTEIAMATKDTELQKKAHCNILKAIEKNERLIEQLLILARLTADRIDLNIKPVNISNLLKNILDDLQPLADEKSITFHLECPKDIIFIAHEESISILINNLVSNSINYSYYSGDIIIKASQIYKKFQISVQDNGPGIPENKYNIVLERFQKIKNHNNHSGSGLGLSIVKHICDLHLGQLKLDKSTEKGGLKVTVSFNQ